MTQVRNMTQAEQIAAARRSDTPNDIKLDLIKLGNLIISNVISRHPNLTQEMKQLLSV